MRTTTLAALWATCAMAAAKPGDLDRDFDPELRAWVAPDMAAVSPDGRAWIGGGFDQGDGYSTGDLVRLGENGGVEDEPAQGYIRKTPIAVPIGGLGLSLQAGKPFLLADGDFLLPGESGGWLWMNSAGGVVGKAFSDRLAGEEIIPQFERDGKLWVIRRSANGQRLLERRSATGGTLEGVFPHPVNVKAAVPAPGGAVWILAGDDAPWFDFWNGTPPEQEILNLDENGNVLGKAKVFPGNRDLRLIAGPGESFRIEFGPDTSRWMFWPAPSFSVHTIEWYAADGLFERRKDFSVAPFRSLPWAENPAGALLVAPGNGTLQLFPAGETAGTSLPNHTHARSIHALPDGKWLVDGLYRLNADGGDDPSWSVPDLSAPAQVTALHPLPDGRMLAGGNFAMADGVVRNRLVVFRKNGTVDPSFIPDDRIGEWRSVAVTKNAIYGVTQEPVTYGAAIRSNLVKLGFNGALDESFAPLLPIELGLFSGGPLIAVGPLPYPTPVLPLQPSPLLVPADNVAGVRALDGGCVLVETYSGGEVADSTFYRLRADGTPDPDFRILRDRPRAFEVITRTDGGFVRGAVIYRKNGTVEKDLTREDIWLRPLCEWHGSVVFLEFDNRLHARLRLWSGNRWAAWFKAPALDNAHGVLATPGEFGTLYVSTIPANGRPSLLRLFPNGCIDRSFRPPAFGRRDRQHAGNWWTAEESGKVAFDPSTHETPAPPRTLMWHPATRKLWVGGEFNAVGGVPRDGLARLTAGFVPWRWW